MKIFRTLALTAAALVGVGLAGAATPAAAADTSWGCGGLCVSAPVTSGP